MDDLPRQVYFFLTKKVLFNTIRLIIYCKIRSNSFLLLILQSIQYIKENPGQACPVDWKTGEKTLYSHPLKSKVYFKT